MAAASPASAAPALSRLHAAEQACQRALQANPFDLVALRDLAAIRRRQGRLDEAEAICRKVREFRPDDADICLDLGNLLYERSRFAEAADSYRQALRIRPDDADGHNNLGAALADLGRFEEAVESYNRALALRPDFADAHYNFGNALRALWLFEEAVGAYAQALRCRPTFAEAHNNLGVALHRLGRRSEAIVSFGEALKLQPTNPHALTGLGFALQESGRVAEALARYEEAIGVAPDFAEAHRNRSLALLLTNDMAAGWSEYEWRLRCPGFSPPNLPKPYWDGSSLAGRRVLLSTEQGSGDTFQFIRFAQNIADRGGVVTLAAPETLHPLLSTCPGISRLVPREASIDPDEYDVHCPLLSTPRVLGITPETLPAPAAYLHPEADRVARWRERLAADPAEFRVGIIWRGSPTNPHDPVRSTALKHFAGLARVPGARLYSLQLGEAAEEQRQPGHDFPVVDLGPELAEDLGTFRESAACLANLDLLVTCCTSLAHLAGAMGRPVWVAAAAVPDFRWLLDRADSPWYPSARLFRQQYAGLWDEPFAQMARALAKSVAERSGSSQNG